MKTRIVFGLVLLIAILRWAACEPQDSRGPVKHLTNRIWFSKVAAGPRDFVTHIILGAGAKKKVGVIATASHYRFGGDVVEFQVKGDQLTIALPQDGTKATFTARTWRCREAPKPFELCFELKRGGRRALFFSSKKMRLPDRRREAEALAPFLPALANGPSSSCLDAEGLRCVESEPDWFKGAPFASED